MSDRSIVGDKDRMAAWMRSIEDRLTNAEQRKYQGQVILENASVQAGIIDTAAIEHLTGNIDLTQALPLRLTGSRGWTQDIEQLGRPGYPGTTSAASVHALVTRDSNGAVVDIWPRPHVQLTTGSLLSVAANTRVAAGNAQFGKSFSGPYTFDQTWDDTNAAFIVPVAGFWDLFFFGTWTAVADATVRNITPQFSSNGVVAFADHFADTKGNNTGGGDNGTHTFGFGKQAYTAGNQIRISCFHRSLTTPLNLSCVRFSATWMRGNP